MRAPLLAQYRITARALSRFGACASGRSVVLSHRERRRLVRLVVLLLAAAACEVQALITDAVRARIEGLLL